MMAPMSRGKTFKVTKPRMQKQKKDGTAKHHRFTSFSEKIANLKIDPIRRSDQSRSLESETSYFRSSFVEWRDLNLSENFTTFAQQVDPLCSSLPQLLHYQNQILDLLVSFIEKEDVHSLEPLLNLIAHFAHDLGTRFERYFERVVSVVARLASMHQDVEVIEWSFSCLAWLFKYLSRLLVPDLRPVFDLMAPLLGKERQKSFATRFAAEATSFLLRKAGAMHEKNKGSLSVFIDHVFKDLVGTSQDRRPQYEQGLALLFSESMKGVQKGLHTSAVPIFDVMLGSILRSATISDEDNHPSKSVFEASLINTMHHTNADGLYPIASTALKRMDPLELQWNTAQASFASRILFVLIGLRKGSRIQDWRAIERQLLSFVESTETALRPVDGIAKSEILKVIATYLQYSPLEVVMQSARTIMQKITGDIWADQFLEFCTFATSFGTDRFDSLVRRDMERFILQHWSSHENQLCLVLPKLFNPEQSGTMTRSVKAALQNEILQELRDIQNFKQLEQSNDFAVLIHRSNQYLDIFNTLDFEPEDPSSLSQAIGNVMKMLVIDQTMPVSDQLNSFILSSLFETIAAHDTTFASDPNIWVNICQASSVFACNEKYLHAVLRYIERHPNLVVIGSPHIETLANSMISLAAAESGILRRKSLEILRMLYTGIGKSPPEALELAISLENSSFTMDSARSASAKIKQIGMFHKSDFSDAWMQRLLPTYCFGLLHVRLASIWSDAYEALSVMAKDKASEDIIFSQVMSWLDGNESSTGVHRPDPSNDESHHIESTNFNCTNVAQLDNSYQKIKGDLDSASQRLEDRFKVMTSHLPFESPLDRSQALLVLKANPQLAEKKSRLIVPLLLGWQQDSVSESFKDIELSSEDETLTSQDMSHMSEKYKWTRKDQKTLLEVFSQFNNPKMLHRAEDVRGSLLELLCNGDTEIQQASLKALFAWKDPSILPYKENLMNLLDDARFRDELTVFVNTDHAESSVEQGHRQDLIPILLRLLYGRMVARSGTSSNRGTQEAKRKSVLTVLPRFNEKELGIFIGIALGSLDNLSFGNRERLDPSFLHQVNISSRKQFGLLRTIQDMLQIIPNVMEPFVSRLLHAVLFCYGSSSRKLDIAEKRDQVLTSKETEIGLLKSVRQSTLKCLQLLFANYPNFSWLSYSTLIFAEIVDPKLPNLPSETAQGVSAILQIFSTWTKSAFLLSWLWRPNPNLLVTIADCLIAKAVRNDVRLFVLDNILINVLSFAEQDTSTDGISHEEGLEIRHLLSAGLANTILDRITNVVESSPGKEGLEASLKCLIPLGSYVTQTNDARGLLRTILYLLKLPLKIATPRLKSKVLQLLERTIPRVDFSTDASDFDECFATLSSLFSFFTDAENRQRLVMALRLLTQGTTKFNEVLEICGGLNAWSSSRLDDPDYDKRLESFTKINDMLYDQLDTEQWMPIIHNALFLIKDDSDLATRHAASLCLRQCVRAAETVAGLQQLLGDVVVPAVQHGIRENSEQVRIEFTTVLAELVQHNHPGTQDLKCLLGNDQESSFFNNIYHLQQHRRARALRRLATETYNISSLNLSCFCLPIVEQHLKSADVASQNTAAEAVNTIEVIAAGLEWQRYRALLHKMASGVSKLESRLPIRALGAVVNALYRSLKVEDVSIANAENTTDTDTHLPKRLSETLPDREKLVDVLSKSVLFTLADHLHFKDEASVELRIMLAPIAVKVILTFPQDEISLKLSGILMDTCNVLKSRSQDARDGSRKALGEISLLVGPSYFGFILKQLRSSLQRGYQIHVLGYTVHQLLLQASARFPQGSLDYCVSDIMSIIIDETFGNTSQEKEARDYISSMKEVKKKNLGFDSMEILATMVTIPQVGALLKPVQEQLQMRKPKMDKIEELLRRLREGLRRNDDAKSREILTLCYEVMRNAVRDAEQNGLASQAAFNQMIAFSTDLLRRSLDKHEDLKTVENLSGFMPLLQKSLSHEDHEVQSSALRCLTSVIKVPLKEIDDHSGDYIKKVRKIIEASSSTNTPLAQAALRLASAVLRERPQAVIKQSQFEAHVAYILDRIKPDLQEPSRQGERDRQVAAFNFIRAVLSRGILIKEIYEVMELVREVMITSNESPIPDLSRSVYSKFILDCFPDKGKGLSKQIDYLISNLQYPNIKGKGSVMEVIIFLISKKDDESVQSLLVEFFLPLVLVLGTDESDECRSSAKALLQKILERADKERTKMFKAQLYSWISNEADSTWKSIGCRCWRIYFDVHGTDDKSDDADNVCKAITSAVRSSSKALDHSTDALVCTASELLLKMGKLVPKTVFTASSKKTWIVIAEQLTGVSAGTKLACLQLLSALLADFARTAAEMQTTPTVPLVGSGGLRFDEDDVKIFAENHLALLDQRMSNDLLSVVVKNLAFVGRVTSLTSSDVLRNIIKTSSKILRAAENETSIDSKLGALKVVSALCKSLPEESMQEFLHDILMPLHSLTDETVPVAWSADPDHVALNEEIKGIAQDTLENLQEKVGSMNFLNEMQKISKEVKERRDERRAKRRIEVVAAPEKAVYKKQKKHEAGKVRRKEKNAKAAGTRRGW